VSDRAAISGQWPFTGREAMFATVTDLVEQGRHVTLAGVAGVGKSRLAAEVAAHLAATGVSVHRVAASPSTTPIPLAAVSTLVGGQVSGDLVGAALATLGADGRSGPGHPVLVVDDAHALDDASAVVIHQLALSGRVRLLMTVRDATVPPEAIVRIAHEAGHLRLAIDTFDAATVRELLERVLGGLVEAHSLHRLVTSSGGNALYLRELVEGSVAAGQLERQHGTWRLVGEPAATPLLDDLVLRRLQPLDADAIDALELLAVGGAIDLRVVERLVEPPSLERLERMGLVLVRADGARSVVDVGHPLVRDVTVRRVGPVAQVRVFRTLSSEAAAISDPTPLDRLQAAVWRVRGGLPLDDAEVLSAARQAMAANDVRLGAELSMALYRATGNAEAALVCSWCLAEASDHRGAVEVLTEATERATEPWDRAGLLLRHAEERWWWAHDVDGAIELLEPHDPDGPWNDLLRAQRAVFAMLDGDVGTALSIGQPLVDHPQLWVRLVASIAVANCLAYLDRADEAFALASASFDAAQAARTETLGDPTTHVLNQLVSMVHAGRLAEARDVAQFVCDIASTQTAVAPRAWGLTLLALVLLQSGQPAGASRRFAEAEVLWADAELPGPARWCAGGVALAASASGDHEEAAAAADRVEGYESTGFRAYEISALLGRLWVARHRGDRRGVDELVAACLAEVRRSGAIANAAMLAHDLARLGLADAAVEAQAMVDAALGPEPSELLLARRWFVEGVTAKDDAALERAAEVFDRLGAPLFAAEAYELAAQRHRRDGRTTAALRCGGRAAALVAECGHVETPPFATRTGTGTGVLSAREHQVATLAAQGRTNKQIAEELFVGERTVESHLYRSFAKLGITSRAELGAALAAQ
jgi:DNA-binding CsgD family transcriptional regulator